MWVSLEGMRPGAMPWLGRPDEASTGIVAEDQWPDQSSSGSRPGSAIKKQDGIVFRGERANHRVGGLRRDDEDSAALEAAIEEFSANPCLVRQSQKGPPSGSLYLNSGYSPLTSPIRPRPAASFVLDAEADRL
jgi:hypothetical protein